MTEHTADWNGSIGSYELAYTTHNSLIYTQLKLGFACRIKTNYIANNTRTLEAFLVYV